MRRSVLLGSIALHAVIGALVLGLDRAGPPPPPPPPRTIDIEIEPPATAPRTPDAGGGAPGATSAPASAPGVGGRPSVAPRPVRSTPPPRSGVEPAAAAAEVAGGPLAITGFDLGPPGGGGSDGAGLGGGRGAGIGPGEDRALAAPPVLPLPPPPPPPERPSRARPPKLIYPARDRDADDSEMFVARVTVDTDGYVIGAHLVSTPAGRRDDVASQLIWRFRYAPALDHEGRAIRSTIDQRFLVGR